MTVSICIRFIATSSAPGREADISGSSLKEFGGRVGRVEMKVGDSANLRSAGGGINIILWCICSEAEEVDIK